MDSLLWLTWVGKRPTTSIFLQFHRCAQQVFFFRLIHRQDDAQQIGAGAGRLSVDLGGAAQRWLLGPGSGEPWLATKHEQNRTYLNLV